MRVLVTGGTGFIGTHLVARLSELGHEVVSSSWSQTGPPGVGLHIRHDFSSSASFPDAGPLDNLVHLAGSGDVDAAEQDPARIAQVNVQGTLAALLAAHRVGAAFILASSQRVYQPGPDLLSEDAPKAPRDVYGYTRLAAELYATMAGRLWGVPGAVLRFFSVYGPGQFVRRGTSGVVSLLAQRALDEAPMVIMSRGRRDFTEVSDVVAGIQRALAAPGCPPPAYNIATGVATSILELAHQLRRVAASSSAIVEDYEKEDPGDLVADVARAQRDLGYQPHVSLEQGLRTYVQWLRTARPYPSQGPAYSGPAR